MPSIIAISEAFETLYIALQRRSFTKSKKMHEWNEQDLLPLVRLFLLGRFGTKVHPEFKVKDPKKKSGFGRIDFKVGDTAIEFAVRPAGAGIAKVSANANRSEVRKLLKFDGKAVLVLFDFSSTPYERRDLNQFRRLPSLGKGKHNTTAFNLCYYHRNGEQKKPFSVLNIRS